MWAGAGTVCGQHYRGIKAKALVTSISSDVLFPTSEQELLAAYIPNAQLAVIDSYYGHDGFC